MKIIRCLIMALGFLWLAVGTAFAAYPEKTINLIVPWKAGGGTDTIARGFAEALKEAAGVDVIITNVNGAAGATGMIQVQRAKPDGYTLLFNGTDSMVALTTFKDNMPFDVNSFKYAGGVYTTPTYVLSHKDRGYTSMKEVIELSKQRPDELTVGIGSMGGAHGVLAHVLNGYGGAKFRIVAFDGGATLKKATIANEIDLCIIHSPVLLSEVKAGMLNVLATGGSLKNINHAPIQNTPTLRDLGMNADIGVTRGVWAPEGTSDELMAKIAELTKKATMSQTFMDFGLNFGFAPAYMTGDEFKQTIIGEGGTYVDVRDNFMNK